MRYVITGKLKYLVKGKSGPLTPLPKNNVLWHLAFPYRFPPTDSQLCVCFSLVPGVLSLYQVSPTSWFVGRSVPTFPAALHFFPGPLHWLLTAYGSQMQKDEEDGPAFLVLQMTLRSPGEKGQMLPCGT